MKLKDIEKSLKNEQKQMGVPDVLARSKKAPINRLLDGQTPLRAFNKPLASRLLWCALILLVTMIVCFAVYMLLPRQTQNVSYGYMSVTIETDGSVDRYGIVTDSDLNVEIVVHESEGDSKILQVVSVANNSLESAIKELYRAKSVDKVCVCAFYPSNTSTQNAVDIAKYIFDELYDVADKDESFEAKFLDAQDKAIWIDNAQDVLNANMSIDELAEAYLNKFLQD